MLLDGFQILFEGQPFGRFLGPLGLTDTFWQGQEKIDKVPAEGYWWTGSRYKRFADGSRFRPNTSAATVAHAAGAMLSSVRDISDWQDALLGGSLLKPKSMELMLALHPKSRYGLGMRRAWLDGKPGVGHGGSLRGFVSVMYRLPEEDLDIVIMTNMLIAGLIGRAGAEIELDLIELGVPTLSYDRDALVAESNKSHPRVRAALERIEADRAWARRRRPKRNSPPIRIGMSSESGR